ncbi:MAG: ROK family protein [Magnetococcales bacterium]|nr:ROK family protein [Magnetococcales bacterium]
MEIRIGIDLGGTKIEAAALNPSGALIHRQRVATPQGDYRATVQAISTLIETLERINDTPGLSVGIGTPGALSPKTGRVINANSVCLIGQPLDRDLEKALGRSVRLANDADCFALSEAIDGAAAGAETVFGVILGTGVGGGLVVQGRLVSGPNGIAGEWGHNPMPWPTAEELPGPACYCGKRGCVETFLSGPGLAADHLRVWGEEVTPRGLVQQSEAGAVQAEATLRQYEARLARALAGVINLLDPHVVVLGGGLSNLERLYGRVPEMWGRHVFSDRVETRLVKAKYGDSSGVRGAAWLWGRGESVEEGT